MKRVDGKRPEEIWNMGSAIQASVFPRHQGGPHNQTIMAVAVAMKQIQTASFKKYQSLVLANTTTLADRLRSLECDISGNGTQTHRLAVVLRDIDVGSAQDALDEIGVACSVGTAKSELHFGSYPMATRGPLPGNIRRMADIIRRALTFAKELGGIKDAEVIAEESRSSWVGRQTFRSDRKELCESRMLGLRQEVKEWMCTFSAP